MPDAIGVEAFWNIYRKLDDLDTIRHDFTKLLQHMRRRRAASGAWLALPIVQKKDRRSVINPLPGLPLIKSPLFSAMAAAQGFTADEARVTADLHSKGYAVLDFPDANIYVGIRRIKDNLAQRYGIDFANPNSNKTMGKLRIQNAWTEDEDVHAIAANPDIIDLLSKLYGRAAFPFQTLNFSVGTQQNEHSDSAYFYALPERFICGAWLAMEDFELKLRPLFYYPGSHRWPIMTNALIGRRGYGEQLGSAQDPYAYAWSALVEARAVHTDTFQARKGQALIWCANLLHGGSHQNAPRLTHWPQVTHYYFEDCICYTPTVSDEALGRLQLRNLVSAGDGTPRPNIYLGEPVCSPSGRAEFTGSLMRWFAGRKQ